MIHVQKIEEGQDSDALLLNAVTTWLTGIAPQRQVLLSITKTPTGYVTVTQDPEPAPGPPD